jgi:hypothetical protein
MNQPPIPLSHETGLLLALRRVRNGHVAVLRSRLFTDRGQPLPDMLVPFLRELFDHGQISCDDNAGEAPVVITEAGAALLAELESKPDGTAGEATVDGPA